MKSSVQLSLFILTTLIFSVGFQCEKEYEPLPVENEFDEKLTLAPYKKTYSLSDTIWVRFQTTDKRLFDKLTNSRVATDTTYLQVQLSYSQQYPKDSSLLYCIPTVAQGTAAYFGTGNAFSNILSLRTDCSAGNYSVSVGFLPLKKGIYLLQPDGYLQNCPSKRLSRNATFRFSFDLADCNKDVFQAMPVQPPAIDKAAIEEKIDKKEYFAFKVN